MAPIRLPAIAFRRWGTWVRLVAALAVTAVFAWVIVDRQLSLLGNPAWLGMMLALPASFVALGILAARPALLATGRCSFAYVFKANALMLAVLACCTDGSSGCRSGGFLARFRASCRKYSASRRPECSCTDQFRAFWTMSRADVACSQF